jgi:hypothetical protein
MLVTLLGTFALGVTLFLNLEPEPANAQARERCWYDHVGGCDSGGWAACGICDETPD